MADKNRVWMRQKDVDDLGQDAGWCSVYSYEPAPPSHEATLVIHDGKPERVFTESEVKAMLEDAELLARTMGALVLDVDEARAMAASDIATIKVRHGLSLDPA